MDENKVIKHIRDALDEIIKSEKEQLEKFYDDSDKKIFEGKQRMIPLLVALNALKEEIGDVVGLSINIAKLGHMATIRMESSVHFNSFMISTTYDNNNYLIEELYVRNFGEFDEYDDGIEEKKYEFEDAEKVIKFVLVPVGKHIASIEVLNQRKK